MSVIRKLNSARRKRSLIDAALLCASLMMLSTMPAFSQTCSGILINPGDSIQAALDNNPGATFCFQPGIYRVTQPLAPTDNQTLSGLPGAVLNGAKLLTDWTPSGSFWFITGQTQGPTQNRFGNFPSYRYPQSPLTDDVFYDGTLLSRVLSLSDLGPGGFFFDYPNHTVWIADDPTGHILEASISPGVIRAPTARGVTVQGFIIEKSSHFGITSGPGWTIQGNTLQLCASAGLNLAPSNFVSQNTVIYNGQYGMHGSGPSYTVIDGNEIAYNNTHLYYTAAGGNWASGATKFVRSDSLSFTNNYSHDNLGDGVWGDISNMNISLEWNVLVNNQGHGLVYEISSGCVIDNNTISGNGLHPLFNGLGAAMNILSSDSCEIFANTVTDNGNGLQVVQDGSRGNIFNTYVHDNVVTMHSGRTGLRVQGTGGDDPYSPDANNHFEHNTYYVKCALRTDWWVWRGGPATWPQWNNFGNDTTGSFTCVPYDQR